MDVTHPRATDVDGRDPPSQVTVEGENIVVSDDGVLEDLDEDTAKQAMRTLAGAYDVEYADDGLLSREADVPFDPSEYTISEIEDRLAEASLTDAELQTLDEAESDGKDRGGAHAVIRDALEG